MYADDHAGLFPAANVTTSASYVYFNASGQQFGDIRPLLEPYANYDPAMFYCPSGSKMPNCVPVMGPNEERGWDDTGPAADRFISYQIWPGDLFAEGGLWVFDPPQFNRPTREGVELPTREILAQDQALTDTGLSKPGFLNHPFSSNEYCAITNDGTGFNNGFHDGHVSWQNINSIEYLARFTGGTVFAAFRPVLSQ